MCCADESTTTPSQSNNAPNKLRELTVFSPDMMIERSFDSAADSRFYEHQCKSQLDDNIDSRMGNADTAVNTAAFELQVVAAPSIGEGQLPAKFIGQAFEA